MKYCSKCNVNVHHQLDNCPLCGAYLDPKEDNEKCAAYVEMDEKIKYPLLHEMRKVNFFRYKFNRILLLLLAFCVVLNLLLTPQSHWSAYVAIGVVFIVFCVMTPINAKYKFVKQVRIDVAVLTLLAVAMEFSVLNGKFSWFTVEYVLPWIYVAAIILLDVLIAVNLNSGKAFATLLLCTVFAMLPQIALWITTALDVYRPQTHINLIIFFAAIVNTAIVYVVANRALKEEMERNFNL